MKTKQKPPEIDWPDPAEILDPLPPITEEEMEQMAKAYWEAEAADHQFPDNLND